MNRAILIPHLLWYALRADSRAYSLLKKMGIERKRMTENERDMFNFVWDIQGELLDLTANNLPVIVYGFGEESQPYSTIITAFLQSKNKTTSHSRVDVKDSELHGFRKSLSECNNNIAVDAEFKRNDLLLFGENIHGLGEYRGETAYIWRRPKPGIMRYTENDMKRFAKN